MKLLIIILALFITEQTFAIINVEAVRMKKSNDGWSGQISLSGDKKSGNTVKTLIKFGALAHFRKTKFENLIIANYSFGSNQKVNNTNNQKLHLRHAHFIDKILAAEVFAQYASNEFTRLASRTLIGAGARTRIHNSEDLKFYFGSGAFHSREDLDERDGLTDDGVTDFWSLNVYLSLAWQFTPTLSLNNTTYYQPVIEDFDDYRVFSTTTLNIKALSGFSISLFHKIAKDSLPPQAVDGTDTQIGTELKYSFN